MNINLRMEQEGYFIAEVSGGERGTIVFDPSENLILNSGFVKLLSSNVNVLQYISVGTGNSPPQATQTMLDNRIATTDRNAQSVYSYVPIQDAPEAFGQTAFSVQFNRGVAAGNLTEVSVGWTSDGLENWSRALFTDSLGNPTAITVRSDEFLRITYVLKRYVPIPWTGSLTYDNDGEPATTTVTISPGSVNSIAGNGSGGNRRLVGGPNQVPATFVDNPLPNQVRWRLFYDLEYGNPEIASIVTTVSGAQNSSPHLIPAGTTITFDPPIPKTNEFDITFDFILTLARRVP